MTKKKKSWGLKSIQITLAFKIVTSSLGVQQGNKLVNSSGSWPAQTNCMEGLGWDTLENLALWNSLTVRIASLRSACQRIIPDPVVMLVSWDSWPTSGHHPCHNHNFSVPDSTRNSAEKWKKTLLMMKKNHDHRRSTYHFWNVRWLTPLDLKIDESSSYFFATMHVALRQLKIHIFLLTWLFSFVKIELIERQHIWNSLVQRWTDNLVHFKFTRHRSHVI